MLPVVEWMNEYALTNKQTNEDTDISIKRQFRELR